MSFQGQSLSNHFLFEDNWTRLCFFIVLIFKQRFTAFYRRALICTASINTSLDNVMYDRQMYGGMLIINTKLRSFDKKALLYLLCK